MIYLLHISDLHLVVNPLWNNMKNVILDSAREKLQSVPQGKKLLVVTGDFHNFSDHTYRQAEAFLTELCRAMDIDAGRDVFVVPGNHDVDQKAALDSDRQDCIASVQLHLDRLPGRVEKLLSHYESYLAFVRDSGVYPAGGDPRLPVRVHVRNWREKLNILHLNTTLTAEGGSKTDQIVDTVTITSDEVRKKLRQNSLPCIVIGHNSFFDLHEKQRKILEGMFLRENISAYLCGDRHKRESEREQKKITLNDGVSPVCIPNIVSYRSSADENDTYSDFGMIWHEWDETTGRVGLAYKRWDIRNQGELQSDGEDAYSFRQYSETRVQTPVKKPEDNAGSSWYTNDVLLEKSQMEIRPSDIRNFLLGGRCKWNLAFSDKIVRRNIVDELYQRALAGGVFVLTGPGGEGKSTILMQVCAQLVKDGRPVFYHKEKEAPKLPEKVPDGAIFILDNPADRYSFKGFLNRVMENEYTLILGARENEWNLLKEKLEISGRDVWDVPMQKLTPKEAWSFADCVYDNLRQSRERKEIKEIFLNNSYGFLYAAMLMAVKEKNSLEEIAKGIVSNLSKRSQGGLRVLAYVVFAEHCKVKFPYELYKQVCRKQGISLREANWALSREVTKNGDRYQTRHDEISRLFYRELFSDSGLSADEEDRILTVLMEFYLNRYRLTYNRARDFVWSAIMKLCGELPRADLKTQQYLIDRILDEVKSPFPKEFKQLPQYIDKEESLLVFYRRCFEREQFINVFMWDWSHILLRNGASWSVDEAYSPAWIYREACAGHNAHKDVWQGWAQIEAHQNNAGDYGIENSARWIYREAYIRHKINSSMWLAWAQLEEKQGNIGDYECENSARWIYRKAYICHSADSSVWLAWAQLEKAQGNIGYYDEENTARWIFKESSRYCNDDRKTWIAWAQMEEEQGNAGNYEKENSARWIYREACMNRSANSSTWLAWAQLEMQQGNIGGIGLENSARWIYREACMNRNADSSLWLAWAQIEKEQDNIGDYEREYTARWIFKESCKCCYDDSKAWLAWAQMEEEQGNVGDYEKENSAKWIYREACIRHNADDKMWLAWAQMEKKQGNVGDYGCENSSRWIYNQGIKRYHDSGRLYVAHASMELSQHCFSRAREILRNALRYNLYSIGSLTIVEIFCNNIDSGDGFCANQLIERMKETEKDSFSAIRYLYHCSALLGREKEAAYYHELLLKHPHYDPENTAIERFIQLCREAVEAGKTDEIQLRFPD